jgi:hypothetical protein
MHIMFTDELFLCFETICSNFTGLWYGQEDLGCHALLILLESCTINICAADISQKVISLQLNRVAVHCALDSAAESLPQPPYPSLHTPSLDPLPSVLTPEEDLHVLPPTKTYGKTLVPSPVTPIPIHADSPSTSFQLSAVQPSPTAANTFAVKETSFPLSCVNINASDGELGHISRQSSSSKHRARRSLLKELHLASLSELIPRKRKLYKHIRNKESTLCKLKKNTRERR